MQGSRKPVGTVYSIIRFQTIIPAIPIIENKATTQSDNDNDPNFKFSVNVVYFLRLRAVDRPAAAVCRVISIYSRRSGLNILAIHSAKIINA